MQIKLKNLRITNFKGIAQFETDFKHITNVFGENGTGKSTVFDSFLWLFFGKNSDGKAQFEVKRLDKHNNFIPKMEAEVSANIEVNGQEIVVKKVLRQKWVKRRGELSENYSGDENIYYWNDVPLKESEFNNKIKDIVDENLFKMISNPHYFNSLKWQERRQILLSIAGNISNDEVFDSIITAANKASFNNLIYALNMGKSLDEYKRELGAKKKRIKEEAENIPSRIDEVRRGIPGDINFDSIRLEESSIKAELQTIDNSLSDEIAKMQEENKRRASITDEYNQKISTNQQSIFRLKSQIQNFEFEAKSQAKNLSDNTDGEIKSLINKVTDKKLEEERYSNSITNLQSQIDQKNIELDKLRAEYVTIDESQFSFDESGCTCPTCNQSLPAGDIDTKREELQTSFNTNKLNKLQSIVSQANGLKAEIETLTTKIVNGNKAIDELKADISNLQSSLEILQQDASKPKKSEEDIIKDILSGNNEYQRVKIELFTLETKTIAAPVFPPIQSNEELKSQRVQLNSRLQVIQTELLKEQQIQKAEDRIKELSEQETKLAKELASLEGDEFAIMNFTKAKIDTMESRINGRFKYVSFKMFAQQVNGGEVECCEALINGVPFSDANNAAKINAGIDIINVLCKHYDIYAPIFIDNRESVTNLIECDSQIVNLIVSEPDKKLRVA